VWFGPVYALDFNPRRFANATEAYNSILEAANPVSIAMNPRQSFRLGSY
jgi:hypothetical protein